MSRPKAFKYHLSKTIHQLWSKVSGIPAAPSDSKGKEAPEVIVSQRHEITCKCGWHGRGSESKREYSILSEETIELQLFCKLCRKYLGFIIYKNAA
jgi:hypothetical protein